MRARIRDHLTYANVVATLCLFLVVTGGTAWAINEWTGANIVNGSLTSADYKNNNIQSADLRDNDVRSEDVANDSTGSGLTGNDVADDSLTGQDIQNQSGVDTCTHGTVRFGEFCVGVANEGHTWFDALVLCRNLGLRLPTLGEAMALGKNYDLPSIDTGDFFWSDEAGDSGLAWGSNEDGGHFINGTSNLSQDTVCVTTPTN